MIDIFEIYQKVKVSYEWSKPAALKEMRMHQYRLTQEEFAALIGVKYETYRNWEKGIYNPSTPALALLHIAMFHPKMFMKNRKEVIEKISLLK